MKSRISKDWSRLVIGWGSDLRGDDAAGLVAARVVAGFRLPGVRVLQVHQLTPELAEDIAGARRVVFVDAYAAADGAPLRVEPVSASPAGCGNGGAHRGDPASLLRLVARLYGAAPEAWLIGVPAFRFGMGEDLSPRTAAFTNEAAARIGEVLAGLPV